MSDKRRERVGCSAASKHCLNPCLHVQAVESCGRAAGRQRAARRRPAVRRRRRPAPRPPLVVGAKPYALWPAPAASLSRFSRGAAAAGASRGMSRRVPRVSDAGARAAPDHGGRRSVLAPRADGRHIISRSQFLIFCAIYDGVDIISKFTNTIVNGIKYILRLSLNLLRLPSICIYIVTCVMSFSYSTSLFFLWIILIIYYVLTLPMLIHIICYPWSFNLFIIILLSISHKHTGGLEGVKCEMNTE